MSSKDISWIPVVSFRRGLGPEIENRMAAERDQYQAYMLRLWQDQGEAGPQWRASLESPHTGERRGFASLEALFAFLEERSRGLHPQAGGGPHQPGALKG